MKRGLLAVARLEVQRGHCGGPSGLRAGPEAGQQQDRGAGHGEHGDRHRSALPALRGHRPFDGRSNAVPGRRDAIGVLRRRASDQRVDGVSQRATGLREITRDPGNLDVFLDVHRRGLHPRGELFMLRRTKPRTVGGEPAGRLGGHDLSHPFV